jgi:hypothetical protein
MKLIINGQTEDFENSTNAIERVLTRIQEILDQENLEFSHLVIDGIAVYQDYENYLKEKIETIVEIIAETLMLKPLIEETLDSAFTYIGNALKPLAEAYYQSPGSEDWKRLADLFDGIGWLLETMNRIDQIDQLNQYLTNYDIWNEYVQVMKVLNVQIPELEQAMINKDQVLIGDLLLYEIMPVFEKAEEKLRFLVPTGGAHVS